MIEMVIRTAVAWLGLVVLIRLSGRRTLGEMSPVDFVVLLISGDMIQQALLGEDASLTSGFLVVLTLLLLSSIYAKVKSRWPAFARAVEGVPTVLVRNGVPDEEQLRASRVAMDDVMEALRKEGLADLEEVRFAVLETSGVISVIPRSGRAELS